MYVYTCILRLLIRMIAVTIKTLKSLSRCENLLTQNDIAKTTVQLPADYQTLTIT